MIQSCFSKETNAKTPTGIINEHSTQILPPALFKSTTKEKLEPSKVCQEVGR